MKLYPNYNQKHVITYTNLLMYSRIVIILFAVLPFFVEKTPATSTSGVDQETSGEQRKLSMLMYKKV